MDNIRHLPASGKKSVNVGFQGQADQRVLRGEALAFQPGPVRAEPADALAKALGAPAV
jgi:hypothetical protein